MAGYLFTSESVTEGHPDKVCDAVSDAILDALLTQDKHARVACETLVKTGFVMLAGEVTTSATIDVPAIVRKTVCEIGYTDSSIGFDGNTCGILNAIEGQSPDISRGVSEGQGLHKDQGAGDQGLMFGFAVDESKELMPLPIQLSHKISRRLANQRKTAKLPWLRPDGKSQVTIQYDDAGAPERVDAVVVSTQHEDGIKHASIKEAVIEEIIKPVIPSKLLDNKTKFHINPTGRFVIGGPCGDAGLTGRKIIVDTYGGMGRHGGGAFSGKDPSKVDRSACYFARYVAKNIVAAKLARRCEVQVAYAIGVAKPMGVYVTTFGTGVVEDHKIAAAAQKVFDFRPKALIESLDLLRPIYSPTAAYGHFGRSEKTFTWEKTDKAAELADLLLPKPGKASGHNDKTRTSDKARANDKARTKSKAKSKSNGATRSLKENYAS